MKTALSPVTDQLLDKAPIDLELVEPQLVEVIEAGIAGAEVVDDDADTGIAQRLDGVARGFQVRDQSAFGNFGFQTMRRKSGVLHDGENGVRERPVAELRRRKIEGQRNIFRPVHGVAAGVAEQLARDDVQDAEFLGERDEKYPARSGRSPDCASGRDSRN